MRELTEHEYIQVSGSGIIIEISGMIGEYVGDFVYSQVPALAIKLPIIGTIDIKDYFPGLGIDVGRNLGESIGATIENIIGKIPLIGCVLNKLIGN
jgi:hypothetical protein